MSPAPWLLLALLRVSSAPALSADPGPDRTAPPPVTPPEAPVAPSVWTGALTGPSASVVPVWLVERHTLPLVRVELSFDTSALPGPPGLRDALGAVWGEGTATRAPSAWRAALERLGADVSVGCGAVRCWGALDVPTEGLAEALALTAEVVRAPALSGPSIARWRRVALREWRTDWLGPALVHGRALGRLTFAPAHRYRADRDRRAFDGGRARVRAAWRSVLTHASPSVVVVGDVTPADILPLDAAFGWLATGHAERPAPRAVAPASAVEGHVFVHAPGANQARVTVGWPAPDGDHPDRPAYALAFRALAGGFSSRLSLRLREEEGLTYRVDGDDSVEAGRSEVALAVEPSRLPVALATLASVLDTARTGGFTDAEIAAARHQAWMEAGAEATTLAGLARGLWRDRRAGDTPGASLNHLAMYRDVSRAEVDAAAARWLAAPRLWLVSGDGDELEPLLEDAGWPVDTRWGACRAVYGGRCP